MHLSGAVSGFARVVDVLLQIGIRPHLRWRGSFT